MLPAVQSYSFQTFCLWNCALLAQSEQRPRSRPRGSEHWAAPSRRALTQGERDSTSSQTGSTKAAPKLTALMPPAALAGYQGMSPLLSWGNTQYPKQAHKVPASPPGLPGHYRTGQRGLSASGSVLPLCEPCRKQPGWEEGAPQCANVAPVPRSSQQEFGFEPKISGKEGNWRPASLESTDILCDITVQKS